jgi:hypothetical protein
MSATPQLKELRDRLHRLDIERHALVRIIEEAEHAEDRQRYTCACVVYNEDADIFDMGDQERAGRRGLGCGLVAKTFSAKKNCPACGGRGIPIAEHTKLDP